jgi:hypothetical protein
MRAVPGPEATSPASPGRLYGIGGAKNTRPPECRLELDVTADGGGESQGGCQQTAARDTVHQPAGHASVAVHPISTRKLSEQRGHVILPVV